MAIAPYYTYLEASLVVGFVIWIVGFVIVIFPFWLAFWFICKLLLMSFNTGLLGATIPLLLVSLTAFGILFSE